MSIEKNISELLSEVYDNVDRVYEAGYTEGQKNGTGDVTQFDERLDGIIALQNGYISGGYKPSEGIEYTYGWENYTVIGMGSCTDEVVVIPANYNDYPVTSIDDLYSSTMKELVLPDTVERINWTVNHCTALEKVIFGLGFTYINGTSLSGNLNCKIYDFSRCQAIVQLELYGSPEDDYAFKGMPDNCKIIVPLELLDEWKSATNWTVFVDHIVTSGFETTEERLEVIEGNVEKVYEAGRDESQDVVKNLIVREMTEFEIPKGIKKIGTNAFAYCMYLKKISIPEGVESINSSAFQFTAITDLVLPESCKMLYSWSLANMSDVISIKTGNTTKISANTFAGNQKCLTYNFTSCTSVPQLDDINAFNYINPEAKIYVPASLYEEWIAATNWVTYKDYIVASDAKSAPNKDNFSIYVDANTLKEIVDYNFLGITLASGIGKSEIHYEGEVPYLRLYGDGVSSEACARLRNIEGKPTGKYLVFAYRLPTTNVETYTGMQVFATTDGTDITGAGDMFYITAEKDDKWHVGVIDIEEAIKSSKWVASGQFACKFNPSSDGTYTISRLRLDWFNKVTSTDSYIDVAYVGICDTLEKAISADPDYTGREFNADYFVNALGSNAIKDSYNGMDYVTISNTIPSNGEVRHYLYDGGEESMLLGASHYIGVLYRNAPEQYCEFHANSSKDLTDSRWYSTQYIMYEQGSEWKFMVFSLPKLADTVCRKLRIDYFNKLTAGAQKSIDIAFVKFFSSDGEAYKYYKHISDVYGIPYDVGEFEYSRFEASSICIVTGRGTYKGSTIVIPEYSNGYRVLDIGGYAFENDQNIDTLILPESGVRLGVNSFQNTNLRVIKNYYGGDSFSLLGLSLEYISILDGVDIDGYNFSDMEGSPIYDFSRHTSVADLIDSDYISVGPDTKIVVPDNLYDEWIEATNWTEFADHICKSSEFDGKY